MNFNRPRWGEWIAAIAGAELILVIFRAWYKVSGTDAKVNAWDALESGRYLLLAAGVLGIVLLLATAAEQAADSRVSIARIVAAVGAVALGYSVYRIATPPADSVDATTGAFLGALAALGIAGGAYTAAREPLGESAYEAPGAETSEAAGGWAPAGATGPTEFGGSGQWSPTPAAEPGVAQAGAGGEMPLAAGDQVALTAGGSRWPSGTVARVIQVFAGGALVEVNAPDGGAERFEVPEEAFERVGAGSTPGFTAAPAGTGDWSPAMPSAAGPGEATTEDWGFSEGAAAGAAAGAAVADGDGDTEGEKRPGFFKRMFGGGRKDRTEDVGEGDATPTTDLAGIGSAAESDTDIGEATTADFDQPEPQIAHEPEAAAREPEVTIDEPPAPEPEPEPVVTIDEPPAPEPEPEPVVTIDEPPAPEPEPEPEVTIDEPPAREPEPEVTIDEPPAPAEEPVVEEPVVEEPVVEPPVEAPPVVEPPVEAPPVEEPPVEDPPPAAAEEPKPAAKKRAPRKKSSGSRKVPKKAVEAAEAAAAGGDAPPSVGDQVALKVGGGRWDAGAKGTVVDVFSAGVIVEFADDDGNTERLDLPFEAVGPA